MKLTTTQPAQSFSVSRSQTSRAFRKEIDEDGICWLTFDTPDAPANVWNLETFDEFDRHIEDLHHDSSVRALVLRSAKERVFIAGADLKSLQTLPPEELADLLSRGQDVFSHLESLRILKIAAIHGACVGGGFETTLACDYRIASDSDATRIGLPETQLGLIPAWGGCTRLSRLIGLPKSLDLIVRGKTMKAAQAKRLGLVHEVVAVEHLETLARRLAKQSNRVKHHHFHFTQIWPMPQLLRVQTRSLVWNKYPWMKPQVKRGLEAASSSANPVLPAPIAAIEVITQGASKTFEGSLALEQSTMRQLMASKQTRQLIDVFFQRENASKKLPLTLANAPSKKVANVAILGAGVMGAGIAYALASRGIRVLLCDTTSDAMALGVNRINGLLYSGVKHHALTKKQARETKDRISYTFEQVPLHNMDLIIEAVVEDLNVKQRLLANVAARCGEKTILATNTSALSVSEIAEFVPHPERVVGLHFFNPAHLMPLVEVVAQTNTTPEVKATVMRFVQSMGKTPILLKDRPGFVVNRILMPYLLSAVKLAERMRDPWELDDAMTEFGMPMGPLRLLDEVGFDVALHVEKTLREAFGDRIPKCELLQMMVNAGMLGKKNGHGFYTHQNGEPQPNAAILSLLKPLSLPRFKTHQEMASYLHEFMKDEAKLCEEEGVALSAADIELAMILGAGYPTFQNLFS